MAEKVFTAEELGLSPPKQDVFTAEQLGIGKPAEPQTFTAEQLGITPPKVEEPKPDEKPSILAGTKLGPEELQQPATGRNIQDIAAGPDLSQVPQIDASKMPTAQDRAKADFGITPEMSATEKALRTVKSGLYTGATGLEQTWLGGARIIADITGTHQDLSLIHI